MAKDMMRLLALWALVHEAADEGWKKAVERGRSARPAGMEGGADAFVDGLAALVAAEKENLKREFEAGAPARAPQAEGEPSMEVLRFELGEIRARLEGLEAALDAVRRQLEKGGGGAGPGGGRGA